MVSAGLLRLRRFNRLLTERIGVFDERYLGTTLPFAQARLLYEVAALAPLASHHLRRLIALDPASLSRTLTALEARRYVRRTVDPSDSRHRIVEITTRGRTLLATLDDRSDDRVARVIAKLPRADREQLFGALEQARKLLMRTSVRVEPLGSNHPDVRATQAAYLGEIARRFGRPLDPWNQGSVRSAVSLIVVDGQRPIGCGALRELSPTVGEIKRMWLHPDARGLGFGVRLLSELEAAARRRGQRELRLDTNARLGDAIALYESTGYRRIERYNDNPDATHFYMKSLRPAIRPRAR
jgi:DNA-binding MarR family transcriptional regulator/GNAT superfamily N-acetyltransferase